jgi:hypothetical protein
MLRVCGLKVYVCLGAQAVTMVTVELTLRILPMSAETVFRRTFSVSAMTFTIRS